MKKNQLAWLLGGALMVAGGALGLACSSSSGSGTPSGGTDSGTGADGTAAGDTGTTNQDGGTPSDSGMAAECSTTPSIHSTEAGTIYCGRENDASLDCPTGQQCCLGGGSSATGYAPQKCAAFGSTCDNPAPDGGLPIECADKADCTANGQANAVCCLKGTTPLQVQGCGYYQAKGGQGILCQSSCAAGDSTICETDTDCPSGQHCTPMKWKLFQLGFCM